MRGRVFWKYVVFIGVLVGGALVASGALEIYFSYQENEATLVQLQREKAQLRVLTAVQSFDRHLADSSIALGPGSANARR